MRYGIVLLVLTAAACTIPGAQSAAHGETPIPDGQGQLVLTWKTDEARGVLGSSWASATADAFDLIMLGTVNRYAGLDQGSGQAVSADPGTYRVIVLAGVKRSSGSATAEFIGSAAVDNVVIELGKRTKVDLVLKTVDLTWDTPGPAYHRSPLAVAMTGKSRNARVGMSLAGASTTQRPRFKSIELWNGYRECSAVTGTPDDWRAEATATVPGTGSSLTIGAVGAVVTLQGPDGQWFTPTGLTSFSWTWPNRADLSDTHPLVPFAELSLPCQEPPTGIDAAITWE